MRERHEILKLRQKVRNLRYPDSMELVNGEIETARLKDSLQAKVKAKKLLKIGFFPGADGMFVDNKDISDRDIMVLGHDQDVKSKFQKSVCAGTEDGVPTWRKLKEWLGKSEIDIKRCFFTNCIMGVRKRGTSSTGISPAFKTRHFLKDCLDLLETQIRIQNPKAIICLGKYPQILMGYLSRELYVKFIETTFAEIDERGFAVNQKVLFENMPEIKPTVIALTHPALHHLNAKKRSYKKEDGEMALIEMLKEVR